MSAHVLLNLLNLLNGLGKSDKMRGITFSKRVEHATCVISVI